MKNEVGKWKTGYFDTSFFKAILIEFKNIIWKKVGIIKIVVLFLPGELWMLFYEILWTILWWSLVEQCKAFLPTFPLFIFNVVNYISFL